MQRLYVYAHMRIQIMEPSWRNFSKVVKVGVRCTRSRRTRSSGVLVKVLRCSEEDRRECHLPRWQLCSRAASENSMALHARAVVWLAQAYVHARIITPVVVVHLLGRSLHVLDRLNLRPPDHHLLLADTDREVRSQTSRAGSMPELKSVRTAFKGHTSRSTAVLQIRPDVQLEVSAQPDLQLVEVGLIGQRWSARVEHPSQVHIFEDAAACYTGFLRTCITMHAAMPH
jgi:hypothetical protein